LSMGGNQRDTGIRGGEKIRGNSEKVVGPGKGKRTGLKIGGGGNIDKIRGCTRKRIAPT